MNRTRAAAPPRPDQIETLKGLARIGPDHGRYPDVIENVDAAEAIVDGEESPHCGCDETGSGGILCDGIARGERVRLLDEGAPDGSVVDLEGHPPGDQIPPLPRLRPRRRW